MYYVYFIRCCDRKGAIKIGHASDVEKRLAILQTGNPYKLILITKIPASSKAKAVKMEKWFHDRFSKKCIRGEWFKGSIKLKQIENCQEFAELDKDWNEVMAENGGRYYRKNKSTTIIKR